MAGSRSSRCGIRSRASSRICWSEAIGSELIIAHQLGGSLERLLADRIETPARLIALDPARAYDVPKAARVLVAVPVRGGNVVVPEVPPVGWPRDLEWVHMVSAGVDEYPPWLLDVARVTCGRGTNSTAIAEFVLASMLAVEKRFPRSWINHPADWKLAELGRLQGKTLGLLGFGSIGRAIARCALAFEMRVVAHRRTDRPDESDGVVIADFETVLSQADHLVIAMPLTEATRRRLDAAALAKVKPGVHLINISRGAILNQDALLAALDAGRVGTASLDVTDPEPLPTGHPLYTHPAVRISPHISWIGSDRKHALAVFVDNLGRFCRGTGLVNGVDAAAGY